MAMPSSDTDELAKFGYKQELDRSLGLFSSFAAGFSYISIMTGVFELFFFVSLFLPRVAPLFFVGGILFHVSLYLTAGHPFFEHILLNTILLLFLDRDWFPVQVGRMTSLISRRLGREPARLPA